MTGAFCTSAVTKEGTYGSGTSKEEASSSAWEAPGLQGLDHLLQDCLGLLLWIPAGVSNQASVHSPPFLPRLARVACSRGREGKKCF